MVPKGSLSWEESHERSGEDVVEKAGLLKPAPEPRPLTSLPELSPHWCMTDLHHCRPEHTLETVGKGLLTACSRMNRSIGSTLQRINVAELWLENSFSYIGFLWFSLCIGYMCFGVFLPTSTKSFVKSSNSVNMQTIPPPLISFSSALWTLWVIGMSFYSSPALSWQVMRLPYYYNLTSSSVSAFLFPAFSNPI